MGISATRFRRLIVALAFVYCGLLPAIMENPGITPVGERESLAANTGIAGGASTGAVYFNPARLALLEDSHLSVSGNVYALTKYSADELLFIDNTAIPYHASGFLAVPSTVVSAFRWGDWAAAVSVLVPNFNSIENQWTFPTPNTSTTVVQLQAEQDIWLGLSLSRAVTDRLALGLSVFGVRHTDSSAFETVVRAPSTGAVGVSNQHLHNETLGATAIAGALYSATDWLDMGLRIRLPLWNLSGSGTGYRFSLNSAGGAPTTQETSDTSIQSQYVLPWDLGFGTQWYLSDDWRVLADVSWQTGSTYDVAPGSAFSSPSQLKSTVRGNLAVEADISESILAIAGFLYSPSVFAAPANEGDARQDFFGVSGGVSVLSGRVRTNAGAFYYWSSGQNIPVGAPGTQAHFSTTALGAIVAFSYLL